MSEPSMGLLWGEQGRFTDPDGSWHGVPRCSFRVMASTNRKEWQIRRYGVCCLMPTEKGSDLCGTHRNPPSSAERHRRWRRHHSVCQWARIGTITDQDIVSLRQSPKNLDWEWVS